MGNGDRVSDVLSVLTEVQRERSKRQEHGSAKVLRIGAVHTVAQRETDSRRFKNFVSGKETLNDALSRRLGGRSRPEFDALLAEWLRSRAAPLESAVLRECGSEEQRRKVRAFFASN